MSNALVPYTTSADASRGDRERNVFDLRLLRAGVDAAQPERKASKTFAVDYRKWGQLQLGAAGGDLEQFERMGGGRR